MPTEFIADPIDVLASFSHDGIVPRRLRWNGRLYTVDRVHSHWVHRDGDRLEHHFSVRVNDADLFQLCLSLPSMTWTLERVALR